LNLRSYQVDLVDRVKAALASGVRSVVMQAGTGSGKTAMAAQLLARATERGYRSLFLAHLDSLIEDTHERLTRAGVPAGFVQAGRPSSPDAPVQVASIATLHARGETPPADFVILDECQRAQGPTVRALLERYPAASHLGLTATPQRGDGKPLGDVFDVLICGPSNRWLTAEGYLVPCDLVAPSAVSTKSLAMDPVQAYLRYAPGTRGLVFAANVAHAEDIAAKARAEGIAVEVILGETSRTVRAGVRARLRDGTTTMLVGVGVFIEGWDEPSIETIVLARAFVFTGSFLQAIGRGLRPWPGKARCRVLDLRGAVYLHGLPDEDRVWSITGAAVRRAEPGLPLRRCRECLAVFRPTVTCPRCGARHEVLAQVPRVLSRAERLASVSSLPQWQRDRHYLGALIQRALRIGMKGDRAQWWAIDKFRRRFGRDPEQKGAA